MTWRAFLASRPRPSLAILRHGVAPTFPASQHLPSCQLGLPSPCCPCRVGAGR